MTRAPLIAWKKTKALFKSLRLRGSLRKMTRSRRKTVKMKSCLAPRKSQLKIIKIILTKMKMLLLNKAN